MFKKIDHVAFIVKDRIKSIKFYENNFGFEKYFEHDVPSPEIEKIVYLRVGDTVLEFVHMPKGLVNSGFHFCLISDDFENDYQRLKAAGLGIEQEPHLTDPRRPEEKNWKRAVFKGPDDESIEIRG